MLAVVGKEIGRLVTGADEFWMVMQQDGRLHFTRVHIALGGRLHTGSVPRRTPVGRTGEKRHANSTAGGLLNHVAQYVVSTVAIDQNQAVDTGTAE